MPKRDRDMAPANRSDHVARIALTPPEAAQALGCSPEFFRTHIDPDLRWIRLGRKRLVPVAELTAWANRSAARTLD